MSHGKRLPSKSGDENRGPQGKIVFLGTEMLPDERSPLPNRVDGWTGERLPISYRCDVLELVRFRR
jgi:hypothetical protein